MCDAVRLAGGRVLRSIADLRAAGYNVRLADTIIEDDPEPPPDDVCLCGVDVDAVLERAGVHYARDLGQDLGDYVVVATAAEAERLAAGWHRPVLGTVPIAQTAEALGVADVLRRQP